MTFPLLVGLLLASSASVAAPPAPSSPIQPQGLQFAQVTFHSRVVVRIEAARVPTITTWVEKKGPHCINLSDIQGTAVIVANSVDIALRGSDRTRMRFQRSCPGLDYYSGFYVVPNKDGKICAGRDIVRDRAGGECAIDKFRKLVPAK
ncbi:hypothetical protein [Sphingomonas sp. MMS24-J13]|uniref:hypothetical protein n=1 Tax=Sphingomonas sp. MMS24-J13 TaxID=3238686 RepID=UPI00384EB566